MIIYQTDKQHFLDDVFKHDIEAIVLDSFRHRTGRSVSKEEIRSWASSLNYMGKVLNDDAIPNDCGVAIEYMIPQTAKRVDFLLTGKNHEDKDCVVIVELKQWESARKTTKDGIVSTRFARGEAEVGHPSYQAWSYAALLEGYNEAVYDGGVQLRPCAYLHNYADAKGPINDPFYADHIERAPLFLKGDAERDRLRQFIQQHVKYGDKGNTLFLIEGGRIRPSKSLADGLLGLLKGNQEFVLIDDQKLVYENALSHARAVREKGKRVYIVEGGPGTGKSVVAVNLLVGLTKAGMVAKYVTKNAAPRAVYEARLVGSYKKTYISNLFVGSGAFTETGSNEFDALVVDEAHRLNEKSGLYGNLGEHQIKEIINAARLSVFFIDESQIVTLKDVGKKETIRQWATELGATVIEDALESQFRCNGSDGYLAWLDNILQVRPTANDKLDVAEYDFRVLDSPTELKRLILERNRERNRARMVAGYCWKWPSKTNAAAYDIEMPEHDFQARWNLTKDGGLWMVSEDSAHEVGCIHTCQGLEADYIGVIVGDDLVVRDGQVITRPEKRASSDRSISGLKKLAKTDPELAQAKADAIIKNTYRTLMTRGMKGCYVYFTDAETAAFFRNGMIGTNTQASSQNDDQPDQSVIDLTPELPFTVLRGEEGRTNPRAVPLIPLQIAAGSFSESQALDTDVDEWVELPDGFSASEDLFVAQVVGESMNRRIPNGAWCLFRANPKGTRQGKIVVAQHHRIDDAETGGSFTVKKYYSEKVEAEGGVGWAHQRIKLLPESSDSSFQPIVLGTEDQDEVRVLAELVVVLI
ncbi:hypothetical protein SAMN05216271_0625 [Halopseudomonas sabulinigri]|uniref:DUF2075 domain-containing protein n=2 Tax=Halopseudomonas sabulinigri TaxID=472181 RepID=A0A1H1MLG3_9GAMM|nr:hypothetical protein SAMN05216271_0625 [Halopseudomonas sabulinigri]